MKRTFDVSVALLGLILLAPLIAVVALLVWRYHGRPILFRQLRPGLGTKTFPLLKFRTMRNAVGDDNLPLPDSKRLTQFGRMLRASSLDELPELINVVKGEMSLVGPRPLLVEYLPLYNPAQARRHDVLPGITGWAQVNGRNNISWEEKLAFDVWYVKNQNFWLDIRILVLTVSQVLRRDGITKEGHDTSDRFTG